MWEMSNNAFLNVNKSFADKREKNEKLTEERRVEMYSQIPRIMEIEKDIMTLGYNMFSAVCSGVQPEAAAADFGKRVTALKEEKEKLLIKHGFPKDFDSSVFDCELCRDTGYVDGKVCTCYKNALVAELYKQSNMGELLKKQTFDKFKLSYYSTKKQDAAESPYVNMEINLKICKDFVRGFDKHHDNLLFYGAPGLGKTFLSSAIANSIIKRGKSVLYQSAGQIFSTIEQLRFGKTTDAETDYAVQSLCDVDLLIIDDLGTEFITALSVSELFRIINTRILGEKSTIISTNLSLSDIKKTYSERILSRIMGHFTQLKFYGEDIRLKTD